MIRFSGLRFEIGEEITLKTLSEKTGVKKDEIQDWYIVKKGIDARRKKDIHFVCTVDIKVSLEDEYLRNKNVSKVAEEEYVFPKTLPKKHRPLIIGSGPAGLFAALVLAENGHRPILIERGQAVEERVKSVKDFFQNGKLDPHSNVQFGEGGAGTFSDGKLTTGINNIRTRKVLEYFVKFGAPNEIIYESKPHIGTDLLCDIVKNIRNYIIDCGGEVRFNACAEDFVIKRSKIRGVIVNGEEIEARDVILAIGHSARDTFNTLFDSGVTMIQKPFSVGARIEHPQELINRGQYGEKHNLLPAADYKLSVHLKGGRGVYTFCMCPGGTVVAAASEPGRVVTNGMSNYKRNGENANSALLVGVNPSDFPTEHPLSGIEFQRRIEEKAFMAGGCNYFAPAQKVGDFLKNTPSKNEGSVKSTYLPGVKWGSIDNVLPPFVCQSMREAIVIFDKKISGFASNDAILTAPETRSSSPVRILRDKETFQSNIEGLYPAGEGAGYAGGIMSAAVDGITCAEKLVLS